MDKSWIDLPTRMSIPYINGIDQFLTFAYTNRDEGSSICCPCRFCYNRYNWSREVVRDHLVSNGFSKNYKKWIYHGEALHGNQEIQTSVDSYIGDDMVGMVHESIRIPNVGTSVDNDDGGVEIDPQTRPNEETIKFFELLEKAQSELYPGCKKFTSLSFIVRMLHIKVLNQWTDKSIDMILELLNEAFEEVGVKLPSSYYESQKITNDLGFTYETWDACPKSYMLFKDEDAKLDTCVIYSSSRWKQNSSSSTGDKEWGKRIAAKQMRYFPLKSRLQRLFTSSKTAKLMRWHADERTDDGVFRHPADSRAWKHFDSYNTEFSSDARNVRLGLATDGFNPFRSMNIVHSTWPVLLMLYNLPPWLCMKQPFFILSVLIDGPKGPGDKIDVYLQPLIEELKELWHKGVSTFDATTKQMFQMHAALLWTISDFPAYANLSGWSTKGEYACPCCNTNTRSCRLKHGKKFSYMGHRRFLSSNHKFRKDAVSFNGKREWGLKPKILFGSELLRQLESEGILTQYKRVDLQARHRREEVREKVGTRTMSDLLRTSQPLLVPTSLPPQQSPLSQPLSRATPSQLVPPLQPSSSTNPLPPPLIASQPPSQQPHTMSELLRTSQPPPQPPLSQATSSSTNLSQPNIASRSSDSGTPTSRKRGRGEAKGIKGWNTNVKLDVQFNAIFHPVGENGARLKGQLGHMVRNGHLVDLTYLGWDFVPDDVKDFIWEEVKANLVHCPEEFRPICMKICADRFRDHKNKTKSTHWKDNNDDPDIASKPPNNIVPEQWKVLVQYWASGDAKKIADRNSLNREHRGPLHNTGQTHFEQIRFEMENNGEQVDKMTIYLKTRDQNDPDVKEIMEEYNRLLSDIPEPLQTISARDKIFHEIFGQDGHGYCKTYGGAVPRSAVNRKESGPTQANEPSMIVEITQRVREAVREEFMSEMQHLRSRVELLESHGGSTNTHKQVPDASSGHQAFAESIGEDTNLDEHLSFPMPPHSPQPNEQVGPRVSLLSFGIPKEELAKGLLVSDDPLSELDGVPLGPNYWKVYVLKANKPAAHLEKTRQGVCTIGEAVGRNIAWRSLDVNKNFW